MNKKSITKNYIYNLISQILSLIVPLITTPYVSRILGADGIGKYSYTLSITSYFTLFGCLGLTTYGQIEIAKNRNNSDKIKEIFNSVFISKSISMLFAIGLYIVMLLFIQYNKDVLLLMIVALVATIFDITWYFQGIEDFKKTVVRNIAVKIVGSIAIFAFVKCHEDLYKYILLLNGITLISNLSMWPYVRNVFSLHSFSLNTVCFAFKGSMIYFIPSVATTVYTVLDKSMIGWITGSNFQNGYYEQAHKIEQIVVTILTSLSSVFLPRMAYLYEQKLKVELVEKLKVSITFILFAAFPMMCGLISISDDLIPLFLGNDYLSCIPLLKIFSALVLAVGLNNALGMQFLMPCCRQKEFNKGVIIGAIFNLVMNTCLITKFGAVGAAISSVISEFIILGLFMFYSKEYVSTDFYFKPFIKYGTCSLIMLMIIRIIKRLIVTSWVGLCVEIISGMFVYFLLMVIIKDDVFFMILRKLKQVIKKGKNLDRVGKSLIVVVIIGKASIEL